jgi:hypothetical protein
VDWIHWLHAADLSLWVMVLLFPPVTFGFVGASGVATVQHSIRDARFYAIDANSLFLSPSESVSTCLGSCLWLFF